MTVWFDPQKPQDAKVVTTLREPAYSFMVVEGYLLDDGMENPGYHHDYSDDVGGFFTSLSIAAVWR